MAVEDMHTGYALFPRQIPQPGSKTFPLSARSTVLGIDLLGMTSSF